jgi:SHS family sialic acid transporter-like MFS transporter
MIPWAASVSDAAHPNYKSTTQFYWAIGATLGGLLGAPVAGFLGRRLSYFLISVGATVATWSMFRLTAPFESSFLPIVLAQGFWATLFFGWLPLYLPELFPVRVRATGAGVAMNIGRFATAAGVLAGGKLFIWFENDYSAVGAAFAPVSRAFRPSQSAWRLARQSRTPHFWSSCSVSVASCFRRKLRYSIFIGGPV